MSTAQAVRDDAFVDGPSLEEHPCSERRRRTLARRLDYLDASFTQRSDKYVWNEADALRHLLSGGSLDPDGQKWDSLAACLRRVRHALYEYGANVHGHPLKNVLGDVVSRLHNITARPR